MSQSGFAEKPQRAKKRANEWCEDFLGCRKAGGATVGRGMSPPAGEKRRCHVHLPAGAPRINQKCAEYSRVKQWDGSPPPNCGEENENGA